MVMDNKPATPPQITQQQQESTMAPTPTKSAAKKAPAKKAAASAPVQTAEDLTDDAETETETETTTDTSTGKRVMPTAVFEVFDVNDIPANPKRQVREGFGTSKWVGTLNKVRDNAAPNTLAKVFEYNGPTGGRLAQKNLEDKVADGDSPFPEVDGEVWFTLVRRYDTQADGMTVRKSGIWIGHGAQDGPLASVDGIVLMVSGSDAESDDGDEGDSDES